MLLMLYTINLIVAVKIAHLIIYNTANTLSSANTNLVRLGSRKSANKKCRDIH
jgi:hypothetical protein